MYSVYRNENAVKCERRVEHDDDDEKKMKPL